MLVFGSLVGLNSKCTEKLKIVNAVQGYRYISRYRNSVSLWVVVRILDLSWRFDGEAIKLCTYSGVNTRGG